MFLEVSGQYLNVRAKEVAVSRERLCLFEYILNISRYHVETRPFVVPTAPPLPPHETGATLVCGGDRHRDHSAVVQKNTPHSLRGMSVGLSREICSLY